MIESGYQINSTSNGTELCKLKRQLRQASQNLRTAQSFIGFGRLAIILFGMGLNIVWLGLLGYGLLSMIKMAF